MEQIKKPKNYKKMLDNLKESLNSTGTTIVLSPIYLGKNSNFHVFMTIEKRGDTNTLWIDYVKPNGDLYDSSDYSVTDDFKWVMKSLLTKEFRTFNLLFGV